MFLLIPDLLNEKELAAFQQLAAQGTFQDGGATTDGMPDGHKRNLQFVPQGANSDNVMKVLSGALTRSTIARDNALIKRIMPPIISKYQSGMEYKSHLDTPFMHNKGAVRTDLSMTLFLSDPESYEGGALILETEFGDHKIKPEAGAAAIYSTRLYHRVEPVTRGERIAVVTWMQSHVADPAKRKVIGALWQVYDDMVGAKGEESPEAARALHAVTELVHMWAEG